VKKTNNIQSVLFVCSVSSNRGASYRLLLTYNTPMIYFLADRTT